MFPHNEELGLWSFTMGLIFVVIILMLVFGPVFAAYTALVK